MAKLTEEELKWWVKLLVQRAENLYKKEKINDLWAARNYISMWIEEVEKGG